MRMSKAVFDELVDQMADVCNSVEEVDSIKVEIAANGVVYVIETPAESGPIRYPRIDSIHGSAVH